MGFNDDMERYMRNRNRAKPAEPSWWSKMFSDKKQIPQDEFTPDEELELQRMEQELKQDATRIARAAPEEQEHLKDEQEQKVSFYQRVRRLFAKEERLEDEYEQVEQMKQSAPQNDPAVSEDFRTLAQIQLKWFDRLPTRVKEEFKESEDFGKYKDILKRRGVAKER